MNGNVYAQMNLLKAGKKYPVEQICPLHLFQHLNLWVDKHFQSTKFFPGFNFSTKIHPRYPHEQSSSNTVIIIAFHESNALKSYHLIILFLFRHQLIMYYLSLARPIDK